jgi:peroxiredoxin Q/BCP
MRRFVLGLAGLLCVVSLAHAEHTKVEAGQAAPDFELTAANLGSTLPGKKDAKTAKLSDFKGKNVVLFFYPKAMTGG